MDSQTILFIILGIFVFSFFFDQIMEYLNLQHHNEKLPEGLKGQFDEEKYSKAYHYHHAGYRFSLISSILSFLMIGSILYFGIFGWLDGELRNLIDHPVGLSLLFFGVLFILSDVINIPFQLYSTFVIEEKFGFNKMKIGTFFVDKIKGYVLTILLGGLVLGALLLLINELGSGFWLWFWAFITVFMLLMTTFYTSLILPIFNKLSPLGEGELRTAIEAYSKEVNFPLDNIYVMDGSRRSAKSNAFFSGMGKRKRIVLYDTLVENHSVEELVAVLAHEVGHYKKKHTRQGLILGIIQTGLTLFILSLFVSSLSLSQAMGGSEYGIHLNLLAFGLLYSPISMLVGIAMNMLSRKNEFEADNYAATTYSNEPLKSALVKLHSDNLSNLTPHPFYVFMNYSHPPLLQRIAALG